MPEIRAAQIKYNDGDEHILRRVASAVVFHWDELPAEVQNLIIAQAPLMLDRHPTVQLDAQLKKFIEDRKGGK